MLNVYIGWDTREQVAYEVCKHSLLRKTKIDVRAIPLKHRELREKMMFCRPWRIRATDGLLIDDVDERPMSTEFAFTRFLVPSLNNYEGWALFQDCDMLWQGDVKDVLDLADPRYAVMVVKHRHQPKDGMKMDGQEQIAYYRKNWSSFILWNCAHPANRMITPELVNTKSGRWLHGLEWLDESLIGHLGWEYNWIDGYSPHVHYPRVIHYTEGGPWFPEYRTCKYAEEWIAEYERWQRDGDHYCEVPTMKHGG